VYKVILILLSLVLALCSCSSAIFAPPTRPSGNAVIEIPNKPTKATQITESTAATQATESTASTESTESTEVPGTENTIPSQPSLPTEPTIPTETVSPTAPPEPTEIIPPTEPDSFQFSQELLTALQALRNTEALPAISLDPALSALAQMRAQEASILWGHTRPNHTDFTTVLSDNHYIYHSATENLHKATSGYPAQWVLEDWLHSQSHKANLLNPAVTHFGIGVYTRNGTVYTAFLFVTK